MHRSVTLFEDPPENRFMLHQLAAHAPPLRSLSAHNESNARSGLRTRRERTTNLHAVLFDRESVELVNQIGYRLGDKRQAIRMMMAPRAKCVSEIRQQRRIAVEIQPFRELCSQLHRVSTERIL